MTGSEISQNRIEKAFRRVVRRRSEKHCPGMKVAVVNRTERIATSGFGHRKLNPTEEESKPPDMRSARSPNPSRPWPRSASLINNESI